MALTEAFVRLQQWREETPMAWTIGAPFQENTVRFDEFAGLNTSSMFSYRIPVYRCSRGHENPNTMMIGRDKHFCAECFAEWLVRIGIPEVIEEKNVSTL